MALSSPGLGSNLDVNGIVRQLMAVESQPLTKLATKEASYQAKLSAYGSLSGGLSAFQSAVAALSNPSKFLSYSSSTSESGIVSATTSSKAVPGTYNINVTQLAQAQTLTAAGKTSTTAAVGTGTITFQFGSISAAGTTLGAGVAAGGIAAGSLSINGTTIVTSASTNSAKALAAQVNLLKSTTGVTATAQTTDTGALGAFSATAGGTYTLKVDGVNIIENGAVGTDGSTIDTRLTDAGVLANLQTAGISFTGSAALGTLKFTKTDGSNIAIQESGGGTTGGFTTTVGIGTTKTVTSSVYLSPGNVTIGGNDPSLAGFTAGTMPADGIYSNSAFTQDASQASGTVTIDGTNNSLQGIRDAINKANLGVTASIVSDGSASPYHLVLTSNKTGVTSSMKISVTGDDALKDLLAYNPADPSGQKLTETTAAKSTALTVNGIAISSASKSISEAIEGITLKVTKTGTTTLTVARDTNAITSAVNGFVKAYNDLNKTLKDLSAYNAETKQGGPLVGDATVRSVQTGIRELLSKSVPELTGNIKTLSDIGVSFEKDGTLSVNSSKLQNAVTNNFDKIAQLFAAYGTTSDSLSSFVSSTSATRAGTYAVVLTQTATQGTLKGNAALTAGSTVISAGTKMNFTVDGATASVALTAGTYSASELASMVQSAINGTTAFVDAGSSVQASIDSDGFLNVVSNRYGSASKVSVSSDTGTSPTTLFGNGSSSDPGKDVAGTIGGVTATGSGQHLTGATGSPMEGLKILIQGNTAGSRGTISFARGYADQFGKLLDSYIGTSGTISSRTNGINKSIKDLGKTRESMTERLAAVEKRYRAQFAALDKVISGMSKTSSFLTQQLANLPKIE
ncbi:MAG TPA: flagellar filament capping protein FliD [Noviherbaspirillum sp.]|nr:flagellar filament capping protein FliD [Noviherbaspirillum sp.]